MFFRSTCAFAALALCAAPLSAQRTRDEARLVFSVTPAFTLGSDLWSVASQPIRQTGTVADTFALGRRVASSVGLAFQGVYFPHEHLGYSIEAMLLGVGFDDDCRLVYDSGTDSRIPAACASIRGASKSATAVVVSAGALLRAGGHKLLTPYIRANAGLIISNQSAIRTIGNLAPADSEVTELIIYNDPHDSRIAPAFSGAVGLMVNLGGGYGVHWELRDNIVGVASVTGATPRDGIVPPIKTAYKNLVSFMVGFDVILERRRGRRY